MYYDKGGWSSRKNTRHGRRSLNQSLKAFPGYARSVNNKVGICKKYNLKIPHTGDAETLDVWT